MGSRAKGTRHTIYTSVSNETYQKLKDAKKIGMATGRLLDYLVENYFDKIEIKLPILNLVESSEEIDRFERGNLPTPSFNETPFESTGKTIRKPSNELSFKESQ